MCLGSPAARPIHVDGCNALHDMRKEIMDNDDLRRLQQVASGTMTWEDYHNGKTVTRDTIGYFLLSIINSADIICAVPSLASTHPSIANWKNRVARGIAVDEAANMSRPHLYAVWGNTLLPEFAAVRPMRPASTIDSIQGQEGDMVAVIAATTKAVGPGFTADDRRLNVMMSRHKSALVVFGDLHVAGPLEKTKPLAKG